MATKTKSTKSPAPRRKRKLKDPPLKQDDDENKKQFKKFKCDLTDDLIVEKKLIENNINSKSLQTTYTTLQFVPHNLIPSLNAHHTLDPVEIYNGTKKYIDSFCTSQSWPLYVSSVSSPEAIDLCHKRVKANYEYHFNLKRLYSRYNASKNKKEYKKAKKKDIYPYIVIKFAELLEQHPDPYFNSKYDWYYTGGNLCTIEGNSDEEDCYVYHVTGHKLDNLVLSKTTNTDSDEIKFERLASVKSKCLQKESSEIFEIQSVKNSNTKFDCIIRQKHFISRYHYSPEDNSNENTNMTCCYSIINNHDAPFISFTTNPNYNSYLITSHLNKTVNLWDTQKSTIEPIQILYKQELSNNQKAVDQNWNCIRYFKPNSLIFTDLNGFTILDQRISFDNQQKIKFFTLKKSCDSCEKISIINSSKINDNYIYFGTTHKLFLTDIRYYDFNKNRKCIVSEWKHQMYLPPTFLDTLSTDNTNEIILTGTAHYEDIRLFEHYQKIIPTKPSLSSSSSTSNLKNYYNSSLPFMPDNNYDAYQNLYLNGICLNTSNLIETRIKCCNTGIKFINNNHKKFILKSNSLGDLYIQQLSINNEKIFIKKNFIKEQWKIYENNLLNKNKKLPLNVTCVEDFSSFKKVFRCKRLDQQKYQQSSIQNILSLTLQQEQNNDEDEEILNKPKRLQKWQRSIDELKKYKDALAKDLLSIWDDIDFDDFNEQQLKLEENNINLKKLSKIVEDKTNATEKISDWFSKAETSENPVNNSILDDEKITTLPDDKTMDLSKLNDTSFDLFENDDEVIQSSQNVSKKKIKKNKYKIGF